MEYQPVFQAETQGKNVSIELCPCASVSAHVSMGVGKVFETRSLMSSTLLGRLAVSMASRRRIRSSTYLKEDVKNPVRTVSTIFCQKESSRDFTDCLVLCCVTLCTVAPFLQYLKVILLWGIPPNTQ